jgi:exosortase E/protease (VPEID-CTERM system)
VLLIFALNAVRIAALLMIGDAGYASIASAGFHSQAGWIVFNTSAFVIAAISKRIHWLSHESVESSTLPTNPVAPYLLPLITILTIGMLTRALSVGFDVLYPLKFAGGLLVLWIYRGDYRRLDWRFGWPALCVGSLVFVVWILAAQVLTNPQGKPEALSQMSAVGQWLWIAVRVCTAVMIVPLAEELAYRGYLMRRLTGSDFDAVAFAEVRWPALALAAAAFGLVHGTLWLPGILAGLAYGLLAIKTGSIGQAIAAHAVTNAWLACFVLAFNRWQLW